MATSSALVRRNNRQAVFDCIATLDADTTLVINHGLGRIPALFYLTGLLVAAQLSLWVVTAVTATQITLTKDTAVGSGDAAEQVRLVLGIMSDTER